MPAATKESEGKIKDFISKHLENITEASKVRFREIQKLVKREFGQGMFMPSLSKMINSIRPDLAKPARKKAARRGRKRGPGRPAGAGRRGPGRPRGSAGGAGGFLIKLGRRLSLAGSKDRVQAVIDKMVAAGQSLGRLKVYALSPVGVSTRVTLE
ncbi:MAG: hypothetical protein HYY18_00885 [Planctomycetes bacterium]|nr:hypothetical protein [Planctomycetota bacterium]